MAKRALQTLAEEAFDHRTNATRPGHYFLHSLGIVLCDGEHKYKKDLQFDHESFIRRALLTKRLALAGHK